MNKGVKLLLLRHGGYGPAAAAYRRLEVMRLVARVRAFERTGQLPLPERLVIEPTQRCNLTCRMCFQDRKRLADTDELSVDQWIDFIGRHRNFRKITLIGGEPFMRSDTLRFIEYLDRDRDTVLCTNATLLSPDIIEGLRRCRRVRSVCISLDAPGPLHDAIRGIEGTYGVVTQSIRMLAPHVPVTVNAVMQDANWHLMPELVDLCADLGARKVKLELERLFHEGARREAMKILEITDEDLPLQASGSTRSFSAQDIMATLEECRRRGRRRGVYVQPDPPHLARLPAACLGDGVRSLPVDIFCQAFHSATIAPDGAVVNCLNIRKPFGRITDQPFEQIWTGEAMNAFRRRLLRGRLTPLCECCPFIVVRGTA